MVKISDTHHKRERGPGAGKKRRNPRRRKIMKPAKKVRRKNALGICPYCRKPVYKIIERSWRGDKPKWVHPTKGNFFHIRCWRLRQKSRPQDINIKLKSPQTPFGQVEIEKSDSEE